jgi:two-component system response regulator MprA
MDTKRTILVVDDSTEMSKVMSDMLEFKGYATATVHSGKEALAYAIAQHPDLILLDLHMPDMDGFDVVRTLRTDPWGKDAKILILTANDDVSARPHDINIGADDYLVKAIWGIEDVETKIRQKLGLA